MCVLRTNRRWNSFWCSDNIQVTVHLRSLPDGKNHPAALSPTIHYSRGGVEVYEDSCVSITNSRLAALMTEPVGGARHLVIWDWKWAQLLFVC